MENQSKHTPGPWLIADGDFVYALHERNGRQVNRFSAAIDHYPSQGGTAEEGRANAHLIAAAPDLLDALKALTTNPHVHLGDLVYEIRESEGEGWDGPQVKAWSDAVQSAIAAITKAEGRGE